MPLFKMEKKDIILSMIPKEVKTILDIGCIGNFYKDYETTTIDCLVDADIKQDLNTNQILPFEDNSFDMVVANQILEHLSDADVLIKEIKRVAKKYVFVGLPNELTWKARIKFLFGGLHCEGYQPFGHKHNFTIDSIRVFINTFFPNTYVHKQYWGAYGSSWIPDSVENFLNNLFPTLYVKEVYYLVEVRE